MKWEEKANWLQSKGYPLTIFALAPESEEKYMASISGEGNRYGDSIESVVSQVYEWVKSAQQDLQLPIGGRCLLQCAFCGGIIPDHDSHCPAAQSE